MKSEQASLLLIALVSAGMLVVVVGGAFYYAKTVANPEAGSTPSSGGGVVPPTPIGGGSDCSGPGDSCPQGYTCIQECGPPVMREGDPAPGYYCERNDLAKEPRMCPICLASNAMIATPDGEVNVKNLSVGMSVWSVDANGERTRSVIKSIGSTAAPASHQVVHLVLIDGREVWVSPNHPTATGSRVADLSVGDAYDGSRVETAELVAYSDAYTYDLLPDSATGYYWANGILLGSTLSVN